MTTTVDPPAADVDVEVTTDQPTGDLISRLIAGLALVVAIIALVVAVNQDSGISENRVEEIVNTITDARDFESCTAEVKSDNQIYGTTRDPAKDCAKK